MCLPTGLKRKRSEVCLEREPESGLVVDINKYLKDCQVTKSHILDVPIMLSVSYLFALHYPLL